MNSSPPILACHSLWTLKTALSDPEIVIERRYILHERIGILVAADEPDITTLSLALEDADAWEDRYMDSL